MRSGPTRATADVTLVAPMDGRLEGRDSNRRSSFVRDVEGYALVVVRWFDALLISRSFLLKMVDLGGKFIVTQSCVVTLIRIDRV
jgi:hypothetical protein